MSAGDPDAPSRPLSVTIPGMGAHGPYCPRRPNLREILANTSPPPWTLAAFMAYLSNNHCLETLEFTMDAGRYKKHYAKMMSRAQSDGVPPAKDREYVQALWQRLVEAYIQPNGSREVNLPSDVRDPIINLKAKDMPPSPETLDPAVTKIYELMEESVLVPFLNSVYPQSAHTAVNSCPYNTSDESMSMLSRTYEDRSMYPRRSRQGHRNSPPPQTYPQSAVEPHAHSYSSPGTRSRQSAPLPLTSPHKSRFSMKLLPTTSQPSTSMSGSTMTESGSDATLSGSGNASGTAMTDDSGSTSSPTNESPMTPPMSPPMSDAQSPKRDSGMWKKLGRLSGMKVGKKKSHGGLSTQEE
ncbi:Putative RGS domain-containing protein [Septoria linicola]|uniref:RGS domain-containing protein n=1 Tax=Septoria linicola TaxID=215465 RepID=A0A9Q9EQJ8_9PEZI|nr:putative RGS domain-containing protein [Septoria linicola]USW58877.1 Putative RGS domain-containing protein [Septoria linicola]